MELTATADIGVLDSRDGMPPGDVFGATVNDAARFADSAGPWEIAERCA